MHRPSTGLCTSIVRVTRAFLPLLEASRRPVIVNVGSALGSAAIVTDPATMESGQSVTEGAQIIVTMATIGADGPTGTFCDRNGTMPW